MSVLNNGIAMEAEEFKFSDGSVGVRVSWKDTWKKDSEVNQINVNISRSDKEYSLKELIEKAASSWEIAAENHNKHVDASRRCISNPTVVDADRLKEIAKEDEKTWFERRIEAINEDMNYCTVKDIVWVDHRTLNYVFKEFFYIERPRSKADQKEFLDFIEVFDQGATLFEKYKFFNFADLLTRMEQIGCNNIRSSFSEIGRFCFQFRQKMRNYEWNEEHPFSYEIRASKPNANGVRKYYVVFNNGLAERY